MASTKLDPAAVRVAVAVLVGVVAVILDSTIVSVALHRLTVDLDSDVRTVQWVSTAYLLALGVVIPTVSWLQSAFGAKRVWLGALSVFLLGSVLCSLAWSVDSLIAFRAVQGAGGGIMLPLMMTMIMQAAPGPDRVRIMSVAALPAAVGPILGPVIGGLILGAGSWRWLFLVNVPLCVAGLVLAWRLLPNGDSGARTRLDVVGLALLSPALVGMLWGLSNVSGHGGFASTDVLAPLIGGAVLLVAFIGWSVRRRGAAIVDLRVLRSRPTSVATALMFLSGASIYGAMLLLPLYWQQLRGADALGAGLLLIPQGVGSLLSRTVANRLLERFSARLVSVLGFVVVALSTVPFALAGAHATTWLLLAALFARGLGLGVVVIPMVTVAYHGLGRDEVPHASILTRIAQQIGGSIGTALLAVILATTASSTNSLATAFDVAYWWSIGFTGLAALISLALPGRREASADRASAPADTPVRSGATAA